MAITAWSGPLVQYGQLTGASTTGLGGTTPPDDYNSQRAPALLDMGIALGDPRYAYAYQPGEGVTSKIFGFYGGRASVDYVPTTASTNAFVSASVVSTGVTTYTLNTGSSSAGTYTTTIVAPETGAATGTLLAIDSTAAYLSFGTDGTVNMWNPAAGTGRALKIVTSSSGDVGTWSISGRDMYGFKMTETIALSQGTSNSTAATDGYTITGQKAFKYVSSITNVATPTSTGVSIGLSNTYGFPMAIPYLSGLGTVHILATALASQATAVLMSSATAVLASTVATQTSTTPDVRGTYASTTASNGTVRLQMFVTPATSAIAAMTSTNFTPLFGGVQYSSI